MAASRQAFKQDMPPAGGYEPINWTRVHAKSYIRGWKLFAVVTAAQLTGWYLYSLNVKMVKHESLENNDAKMAIEPLLWAERDREFLKQIRRNREEEEKLMKNVPGWETGKYYGEPVYSNQTGWVNPTIQEYYSHAHEQHLWERLSIQHKQ